MIDAITSCTLNFAFNTPTMNAQNAPAAAAASKAKGLGWIKGVVSPHYNERQQDFDIIVSKNYKEAIGLENNAMLEIIDGQITGSICQANSNIYRINNTNGIITKTTI